MKEMVLEYSFYIFWIIYCTTLIYFALCSKVLTEKDQVAKNKLDDDIICDFFDKHNADEKEWDALDRLRETYLSTRRVREQNNDVNIYLRSNSDIFKNK